MAIIFLALSIVAAGMATLILFAVFSRLEARVQNTNLVRQQELVDVVVAARNLEPGSTLREDMLVLKKLPRSFVLDTMVNDASTIFGRVPRERVLAGEPVRRERLADPKAGVGMNALIPKGQRALQVELAGAQAVAGFITPGDYVDLLYTGEDRAKGGKHTRVILQSKLVLAVDEHLAVEDEGSLKRRVAPSVTLALSPPETQVVAHARATGTVTLTLRNHVDVTKQEVHGIAPGQFIGASTRKTVAEVVKERQVARPVQVQNVVTTPVTDKSTVTVINGQEVRVVENDNGTKPAPPPPQSP
jgi:pilus assembly protein CpaB